ncbi:methyltransferase family protein [Agromyces cerinus]|uniref:Protein-S-isoprenylcysteine O-methyltransferase Ste14 n=1 Tax=Agromyces cerinus subsp. cerinus TaxID=232089 RepID=A0A1N6F3Q7_9MICO|nr:methyltransferase [Agromyces cerinus]SIN89913.1 Protein-S-isoprenylcysteine O-methyltransferase Ste14 [Agromyces cerinus subsp. cerinus]
MRGGEATMSDRANWLVWAQFALLALLLLPGDPLWSAPWVTIVAVLLALAGAALAVAGVAVLGRDLVPWVAPKPGAPLRVDGVYRFTRNPIYLGILIGAAGWVLWRGRIELIVVWVLLAAVLIMKAHVEQHRLADAYGDEYRAYAARTPLLLFARGIR